MIEDYSKEPAHGLLRYSADEVKDIRQYVKLDNKKDRETAIAIIDNWVKSQEHFMKKDYSKEYIERCIITCNGSLEKAKKQIDKMCTFRTLMPQFFDVKSVKAPELRAFFRKTGFACITPKLTKQYHRAILIKGNPNLGLDSAGITQVFKILIFAAEYLKSTDYCLGFHAVFDIIDTNVSSILPHINLVELQQLISIFTQGYGCKVKGIYLITHSKLLETFIRVLKPILSEKVANRVHAVADRKLLKNLIDVNILPEDYGGPELSVEQLFDKTLVALSKKEVEDLVAEMKKGTVDESKRRTDIFNDDYMGVPGTFRTLSLD